MAEKKATVASGADPNAQQLRQRIVPGSTVPGAPVPYEQDELKIHGLKKVHSGIWTCAPGIRC